MVRRRVRQVLGRHADEDDLVQEVFLRLTIRLRQAGPIAVAPWLAHVSRNVAIDELRRRRATPTEHETLEEAMAPAADDGVLAVEGRELDRVLGLALRQLPRRQRQALVQRIASEPATCPGEPMTEAARANLVARARHNLRQELATRWKLGIVPGIAAVARSWRRLHITRGHSHSTSLGRMGLRSAVRHGTWRSALASATVGAGTLTTALVVAGAALAPGPPTWRSAIAPSSTRAFTPMSAAPVAHVASVGRVDARSADSALQRTARSSSTRNTPSTSGRGTVTGVPGPGPGPGGQAITGIAGVPGDLGISNIADTTGIANMMEHGGGAMTSAIHVTPAHPTTFVASALASGSPVTAGPGPASTSLAPSSETVDQVFGHATRSGIRLPS